MPTTSFSRPRGGWSSPGAGRPRSRLRGASTPTTTPEARGPSTPTGGAGTQTRVVTRPSRCSGRTNPGTPRAVATSGHAPRKRGGRRRRGRGPSPRRSPFGARWRPVVCSGKGPGRWARLLERLAREALEKLDHRDADDRRRADRAERRVTAISPKKVRPSRHTSNCAGVPRPLTTATRPSYDEEHRRADEALLDDELAPPPRTNAAPPSRTCRTPPPRSRTATCRTCSSRSTACTPLARRARHVPSPSSRNCSRASPTQSLVLPIQLVSRSFLSSSCPTWVDRTSARDDGCVGDERGVVGTRASGHDARTVAVQKGRDVPCATTRGGDGP